MPKLTIDGKEIVVEEGTTVIQACETLGIEIPRFCYHERLAIAGNCRMCLVEMEKSPKPVASCAQPALEGMVIKTDTPMVKKAREGVMEFLLINHPLDCPICDQGGECDLQDQAFFYGRGKNRYTEEKRAVKDKYMGPLVATHMTRCIHCTRCVRFLEDVAGTPELGAIGRGEEMEVTTYIEKSLSSELSGNIIDLCPVGALTSKPYAFKARNWELKKTETIDVLDAVGSNIRADSRGREIMRILPRINDDINEEWISDKTRFSYDGLKYQRLDTPMVKKGDLLEAVSWEEALSTLADKITKSSAEKIGAIAGDLTDVETMLVTKEMLQKLGSANFDCRQDGSQVDNKYRSLYTFNTTIAGIEQADVCLIIGSNPRHEAAILNARIRKAHLYNNLKVAAIGEKVDLTYPYRYLGNNAWILKQIADGDHPYCSILNSAKNPMIIIGSQVLCRDDFEATLYQIKRIVNEYKVIRDDWNGFNVLQRAASRVGGLDIGFIPGKSGKSVNRMVTEKMDVLFLLGADEINFSKLHPDTFVVYIGHHGDKGAHRADIILPGAAYTEKEATYVNLEGRPQRTNLVVYPPNEAKEDRVIISDIIRSLRLDLDYSNVKQVRNKMSEVAKIFEQMNRIKISNEFPEKGGKFKDFLSDNFTNPFENYYMTDPISRNSRTMALCTKEITGSANQKVA
ncbi:NADH-quinone oxidoreductase subunit G [Holosporaceae bacterium 'Namur']|nr:NADH-quinone oxidoreductase subunit G [Holosporaceae bacterium 'Namur']